MNLKLDLKEALHLSSFLDALIHTDFFDKTSDDFQSSIVRVHNCIIDFIISDFDIKEE